MPDKKKTAPLATNGTVTTSDACNNHCDDYSTVSLDIQEDFESLTYNGLLKFVTDNYLFGIDVDMPPSPAEVESQLLQATNNAIESYNLGPRDPSAPPGAPIKEAYPDQKPPGERIRKLRTLTPWQIARVIKELHHAVSICWTGKDDEGNYDIGIYQREGAKRGTYDTSQDAFETLVRQYHRTITSRDAYEVMYALRGECERVTCTDNPDYVAVNNGIYDYKNKVLMDFSPEFVFTNKCRVNYVENAANPVISNDDDGTDWDVVSWMNELSDEPGVVNLLWEIMGAMIRTNVPWNKTVWFYSTLGNNGKGTLCTLMRNLCGAGAWASIPLKMFSKDFMLEPLMRVSAVITDENDTGTYVDDAAVLKSIITGDPFLLNRKFKDPRTMVFRGFMVQCVNELPRLKDRSESMYRRLLVVPFEKRFEGCERKYIKSDYLYRQDVLEYVLFHLLHDTNYYELSVPDVCVDMLNQYRVFNDPVREFCETFLSECVWDLLPWGFLHDLYTCWMERSYKQSRPEGLKTFKSRVESVLADFPEWSVTDNAMRPGNRMDKPEMLIIEYDVKSWMNKTYKGQDPAKLATVDPKPRYRGLVRDPSVAAALAADAASGTGVTPDGNE